MAVNKALFGGIAIALMLARVAEAAPAMAVAPGMSDRPYGTSGPDGGRQQQPPPDNGPHLPGWLFGVVGGLIVGAVVADALTGKDLATPEELDNDGPRFPTTITPGHFQVQGYATPGWPVALDYETSPDADTTLEVAPQGVDGGAALRFPMKRGGGRHVVVISALPGAEGFDQTRPARYSVISSVMSESGKAAPAPLIVHGIGAGPRAVGSMTLAIEQVNPLEASRPVGVSFLVDAFRPFDRSVTEVLRMPPGTTGKLTLVRDQRTTPLTLGPHAANWANLPEKPNVKETAGLYVLQARAWLVGDRNDQRDWTGVSAPAPVQVN